MIGLTPKQAQCLSFLRAYIDQHDGVGPTFTEMEEGFDVARSRVHVILTDLERRGVIRRMPNRARAIEIIDDAVPDYAAMTDAHLEAAFSAALRELGRRRRLAA